MNREWTIAYFDTFIPTPGSKFDKYGNLNNWWKNGSLDRFQQRTMCMVKQYQNFTSQGNNVNLCSKYLHFHIRFCPQFNDKDVMHAT